AFGFRPLTKPVLQCWKTKANPSSRTCDGGRALAQEGSRRMELCMKLQLEAMALVMPEVAEHPNRLPFRGVLTLVGVPSQHSPAGAQGHRVTLSYKATEAALPSLLGMALDYSPAMDGHDARRKIGIITDAEIHSIAPNQSTGQLSVAGFLYARD